MRKLFHTDLAEDIPLFNVKELEHDMTNKKPPGPDCILAEATKGGKQFSLAEGIMEVKDIHVRVTFCRILESQR